MVQHIWSDRRQGDRRSDATAPDDRKEGDRRKGERRGREKRQFVRLAYPPTADTKVLNGNFRITDMSEKGIAFHCTDKCEKCTSPITLKSIVDLKIQFHDEQIIDIKVDILRCERNLDSQEKTYAGFVAEGISAERIAKEQTYLLSHFPEFCRVSSQ
ncbi:MAG: PilZ domain-containing protein [Planctomycetota bacterium]|jgi:hypothetical protein